VSTPQSEVDNRRRLQQVEKRLTGEFPDLAVSMVQGEVRTVSAGLLARARFTDFVPLLVYRMARERLREQRAAQTDATEVQARIEARSA